MHHELPTGHQLCMAASDLASAHAPQHSASPHPDNITATMTPIASAACATVNPMTSDAPSTSTTAATITAAANTNLQPALLLAFKQFDQGSRRSMRLVSSDLRDAVDRQATTRLALPTATPAPPSVPASQPLPASCCGRFGAQHPILPPGLLSRCAPNLTSLSCAASVHEWSVLSQLVSLKELRVTVAHQHWGDFCQAALRLPPSLTQLSLRHLRAPVQHHPQHLPQHLQQPQQLQHPQGHLEELADLHQGWDHQVLLQQLLVQQQQQAWQIQQHQQQQPLAELAGSPSFPPSPHSDQGPNSPSSSPLCPPALTTSPSLLPALAQHSEISISPSSLLPSALPPTQSCQLPSPDQHCLAASSGQGQQCGAVPLPQEQRPCIAAVLRHLRSLHHLDLDTAAYPGYAAALTRLTSLTHLSLFSFRDEANELGQATAGSASMGSMGCQLAPLAYLTALCTLRISFSGLHAPLAPSLLDALSHLTALTCLDFRQAPVHDRVQVATLAASLQHLTRE